MYRSLAAAAEQCPCLRIENASQSYPGHELVDDLPIVVVDSPLCHASISAQGAQLLEFVGPDHQPLLWLSPAARFEKDKSARGGIPICLPWFGKRIEEPEAPQHGFLRYENWKLVAAGVDADNSVRLDWLHDQYSQKPSPLFEWCFSTRLLMRLGNCIELQLSVTNHHHSPMPLTWALHSYHPVSELEKVTILGLQDCEYLDNTRELQRFRQHDQIAFSDEFDRIYVDVPEQQTVLTEPALHIHGDNCHSAIVWNPGPDKAAGLRDLGAANYRGFICLERGNAADNRLSLEPGETHTARVSISSATASA